MLRHQVPERQRAVAKPCHVGDRILDCSVSLGLTLCPDHGEIAEELIANADAAMYASKRNGPGKYRVFGAALARWENDGGALTRAATGT